ncbi:MAG TPA: 5-formyltetrahydrofolate cyclo-ligase, partial [Methylomirabilota bacterium]
PEPRENAGRAVAAALAGSRIFLGARRIALYAALPDELPSRPTFEAARAAGHEVLLPRVAAGRRLVFHPVRAWDELRPGRYGVPEPDAAGVAIAPGPGDLVLVPGVAFDAAGHRLGRGGGFYDATFPPGAGGPLLVGVGFELQIVDAVPHAAHDRSMDAIVTERGLRRCGEET